METINVWLPISKVVAILREKNLELEARGTRTESRIYGTKEELTRVKQVFKELDIDFSIQKTNE